ncbi:MAG: tetratricopeptide repeat protein [Candidatus Eisenbacteria bacterium]|uniref:Tetratricopeptide repeat protein n=1 Tax=Eiseniibacteriota bacterium TaxID=2212470 RepID=A0A937X999_UNCEI|nr:tetratricopeptide repeat protein [Candidatus Eisenbacteria bacterium]
MRISAPEPAGRGPGTGRRGRLRGRALGLALLALAAGAVALVAGGFGRDALRALAGGSIGRGSPGPDDRGLTRTTGAPSRDSRTAETHNSRGVALAGEGRIDEAIAEYRRAIALDPDLPHVRFNLSNALRAKGRMAEMVAELEHTVRLQPGFAEAWSNLGLGLAMLNRLEEAAAAHRRVIELRPDQAVGHVHLGTVLFNMGRISESMASYERALEVDPRSAVALRQLAWIQATHQDPALRDPARAIELAERADEVAGGADARALDALAVAYAAAQRPADALRAAERALDLALREKDAAMAELMRQRIRQFQSSGADAPGR